MPPGTPLIRAGTVEIELGTPISTAGLGPADRGRMVIEVRARIAEMLGEPAEPVDLSQAHKSPG